MGFRPEARFLERAGYLPSEPPKPPPALPVGLHLPSRIIPPLSLGLLIALIFGALAFFGHARLADERLAGEHRNALRTGIEKFHLAPQDDGRINADGLRLLENFSGVRMLKWEVEPNDRGRDILPVLDGNGRILGWLSWKQEWPMSDTALRFVPLWLAIMAGLITLGGLSVWYMRRFTLELIAAEVSARKRRQEDPLTGLPNAGSMFDILEKALATREPDEFVTCCYLDLTGFRELSDSFGRIWSSDLVRVASARIVDPPWPGAIVGRLGRHRFIIVQHSRDPEAGRRLAEGLTERIEMPMTVQGQSVHVKANIGITCAPRDGLTCDELFRHATLAMRAAKRKGRGNIVVFQPSMDVDLHERRFLELGLKQALDEDALEVHYQPIVTAEGSRIVGVEALLRWTHPTRGNIPPMVFVPVAEQTGMMSRLGEFVLYRALNDAKRWPDLYIAINLSPIQVKDRSLYVLVSSMLAETGIEPSRVVLEITEGVLIDDPDETRKRLDELRALGVRIALDDFGAGYSSLRYLQYFPFDKLKIDSVFVQPLGQSANSGVIVQAIVALGRALDLSVLVEGVETEEQRVLLRLAGCDEMQGYLFGRPGPRETIDQALIDAKLQAVKSKISGQKRASA
ncbi:MAG: bifunctional diguanylate cyclase/phosphodiesterase [Xanthobacteraceae bacterium]